MSDTPPHVPPIPANAKTAGSHAPPADMSKPPQQPTPSQAVPESEDQAPPQPQPTGHYDTPNTTEAMFTQLRTDQARLERVLLLTTCTALIAIGLCLLVLSKKDLATSFGGES